MSRKQALRLTLLSFRNARVRVILLAALMVTGITGRMLYGYFFGHLVSQAAGKGETHRVQLVAILPPGRDIQQIIARHSARHGGMIASINGILSPVYTRVGRLEVLALDWEELTGKYPGVLRVTGRLPALPGEVALPQNLARAAGTGIGQHFQATSDPNLQQWVALEVVGIFEVNPQGNIPPTLLDRPLVSTASVSGPRNVGIVVSWTPPPTRLWAPGPAATPRQLAMQLRTMYNITYTTATAGFWGWDSLPVFITGDWARHVTTILSWNIYAEGSRILGVGYAFIALGIYSVLIIALISRRRELAINKTIGLSPRQLVFVFGLEVAAVSTVSFAVSTIAVSVLGNRVASVMGLESRVSAISVLQTLATMGTLVVMASIIPLAMAAAATVNQLLYGQKIYLFKRRVLLPVDGGGER